MPSSVKDRLNNTFEHVFHFVKAKKYYYDLDAIRVPYKSNFQKAGTGTQSGIPGQTINRIMYDIKGKNPSNVIENKRDMLLKSGMVRNGGKGSTLGEPDKWNPLGCNPGDFWNITTQPFKGAHFAVFPRKLVEQPLKASCPLKVCSKCGKPMVMKKEKVLNIQQKDRQEYKASKNPDRDISVINTAPRMNQIERYRNLGYISSCDCNAEFVPGTVLDPFAGSGTTCVVAKDMRLNYIGIETNIDYIKMALKRLNDTLVSKRLGDV